MTIPHIIGYLILTTPFLFWLGAIWYRYDLEALITAIFGLLFALASVAIFWLAIHLITH